MLLIPNLISWMWLLMRRRRLMLRAVNLLLLGRWTVGMLWAAGYGTGATTVVGRAIHRSVVHGVLKRSGYPLFSLQFFFYLMINTVTTEKTETTLGRSGISVDLSTVLSTWLGLINPIDRNKTRVIMTIVTNSTHAKLFLVRP